MEEGRGRAALARGQWKPLWGWALAGVRGAGRKGLPSLGAPSGRSGRPRGASAHTHGL